MNDRLSASWVMVAGSVLIGIFYYRTKKAAPRSIVTAPKGGFEGGRSGGGGASGSWGTPPILPKVGPNDITFQWPPEAQEAFRRRRTITPDDRRVFQPNWGR